MLVQRSVFAALAVAALPLSVPIDSGPAGSDTPARLVSGSGYTVYGALAGLPMPPSDDGDPPTLYLITGDVATAAALDGLELPDPATATVEDLAPVWMRINGVRGGEPGGEPDWLPTPILAPSIVVNFASHPLDETRAAVGWTIADITAVAEIPTPPYQFTLVAGDFDDSTLPATLPEVADGVVTLGEGDDMAVTVGEPNVLDQLGRPQRLAQRDGVIAFSPRTDAVAGWAASTTPEVVTDHAGVAAVARALDDRDAVSAVISSMGLGLQSMLGPNVTQEQIAQMMVELAETSISTPIDVVAIGWSVDDDGESVITIAYHVLGGGTASGTTAQQVQRMFTDGVSIVDGNPLTDRLSLQAVEVDDSGVVVASLSLVGDTPPTIVHNMLIRSDLPFTVI